jgi:hypothetical protein
MYKPIYEKMYRKKLNNRGSAFVMTLSILALIALLGTAAASAAVVNVQMRAMNRASDKNFYDLESIWDEIYVQMGESISEMLKTDYAQVLGNLYKTGYETNGEANARFAASFKTQLFASVGVTGDSFTQNGTLKNDPAVKQAVCSAAADYIRHFYTAGTGQTLNISVDNVTALLYEYTDSGEEHRTAVSGLLLEGLCLELIDEKQVASTITMDLKLAAPEVRFLDSTKAFSDYILVANGAISVSEGKKPSIAGSVRGSEITVSGPDTGALMNGNQIIADNIRIQNSAYLQIGTEETDGVYENNIWTENLILSGGNTTLQASSANFYIKDDLTINGGSNQVSMNGGSYYGYGNEGTDSGSKTYQPAVSSAILINGDHNTLTINPDTLLLAGRSYLQLTKDESGNTTTSYPMAESVAQKSTQSVYLMNPSEIKVDDTVVPSNPFPFPAEKNSITVTVAGKTYLVNKTDGSGLLKWAETADVYADPAILYKDSGSKIYVFYNVDAQQSSGTGTISRKQFFENLVQSADQAETFVKRLENSGNVIQVGTREGTASTVTSAGTIYTETVNNGSIGYQFVDSGTSSSIGTVSTVNLLKGHYTNLKTYLTRNKPNGTGRGAKETWPAGYYVRRQLNESGLMELTPKDLSLKGTSIDGTRIVNGDCTITLNSGQTTRQLVLAGGNVTIQGSGTFEGLILSFGNITINGDVTLKADPEVVDAGLTAGAGSYFYDYSEAAAAALNDYSAFVEELNWKRGRRTAAQVSQEGGDGE